jgi:hypothetical protein
MSREGKEKCEKAAKTKKAFENKIIDKGNI